MQETNRPELEDAQRFRRVWQRVQGGREEAERATAEEAELPVPSSGPGSPPPFSRTPLSAPGSGATPTAGGGGWRRWQG